MKKIKSQHGIVVGGGFGSSGLSALMDLLSEVKGVYTTPQEFRLFNDPDGITTLETNLVDNWSMFQGNVSVRRFLKMTKKLGKKYASPYPGLDYTQIFGDEYFEAVNDYISGLIELSFMGLSYGVDTLIKRQLNQRIPIFRRSRLTNDRMYVAKNFSREEFISHTQDFVSRLASAALKRSGNERLVIDEGFASMNINRVIDYLPAGSKIVVVVRDPRDVYSELKASNDAWMFQPKEIDDFCKYQRQMFSRWESQKSSFKHADRLLEIKFDELILDYDKVVSEIFDFLEIEKSSHVLKFQRLNPKRSSKNVNKWQSSLTASEKVTANSILGDVFKNYNWGI